MNPLEECATACPSCGEPIQLLVDTSLAEQEYVEDCQVCCAPMVVQVRICEDGPIDVLVRRENE